MFSSHDSFHRPNSASGGGCEDGCTETRERRPVQDARTMCKLPTVAIGLAVGWECRRSPFGVGLDLLAATAAGEFVRSRARQQSTEARRESSPRNSLARRARAMIS